MSYVLYMTTLYIQLTIHCHFQWIIVDSRVYDVSKFANLHPGGAAVLLVDSIGNTYPLPCCVEALIDSYAMLYSG